MPTNVSLPAAPPSPRQSAWAIALHWLVVLALAMGVGAIWARQGVDDKGLRLALLGLHQQLGLLIGLSVPLRWAVRAWAGWVDASADLPKVMRWAAKASHLMLYGVLMALPLLGWTLTNARGHALHLMGWLPLPSLVEADPDLADVWLERHEMAATLLAALLTLHVAAALWHHLGRRDGVLRAMLPGRRRR